MQPSGNKECTLLMCSKFMCKITCHLHRLTAMSLISSPRLLHLVLKNASKMWTSYHPDADNVKAVITHSFVVRAEVACRGRVELLATTVMEDYNGSACNLCTKRDCARSGVAKCFPLLELAKTAHVLTMAFH
jgi:hypothetical protein